MFMVDVRIGGITMGFMKDFFNSKGEKTEGVENEYYDLAPEEAMTDDGGAKMILLEPRAYSEAQQIADHLKKRNTVVVNLKRVTSDQAKRIMDFLTGTIYAIKGNIEKVGSGIFLCTPNNINVQGKITDDNEEKSKKNDDDNFMY